MYNLNKYVLTIAERYDMFFMLAATSCQLFLQTGYLFRYFLKNGCSLFHLAVISSIIKTQDC